MSATGKRYGLAVDWWVDERSDPEKATRAAARYLKDLYGLFGDWNLALAGYNAGEGKVLRGMSRYRKTDYWELRKTRALRPETKNYVPLIHAAIVVAKAPERYGFVVTKDALPDFERVAVKEAYDLRVVAECVGEPVETLRELNPELRRLATPADRAYDLRVPPGRGETLRQCLADLPADKKVAYRKLVVRRGQTLASIARANGVSAQAIAEANLLVPQRRLRPGTELVIPVPAGRAHVVAARREATQASKTGRDHHALPDPARRHPELDRGRPRHHRAPAPGLERPRRHPHHGRLDSQDLQRHLARLRPTRAEAARERTSPGLAAM